MEGADVCFHTFAFNQQKLCVCDEKIILYDMGFQIALSLSILALDLLLGSDFFFCFNLKENKNENYYSLIHSPMQFSLPRLLLFNSKLYLSMAMKFWHDTMHNSYVSPCKIPLWSSFPADPPKILLLAPIL